MAPELKSCICTSKLNEETNDIDMEDTQSEEISYTEQCEDLVRKLVSKVNTFGRTTSEKRIRFSMKEIDAVCLLAKKVLSTQGAFLEFPESEASWAILGDIHGQYNDMIDLLRVFCENWASHQENLDLKYLFLGDYVDRGDYSLEVMVSLLCWKILCPDNVYLLRGNHECITVNGRYGFKKECVDLYGMRDGLMVWRKINEVFDYFPLACTIHDTYFCVHGGLSEGLNDLTQLKKLSLPVTINEGSGTMENQILWSDPDRSGRVSDFRENPRRGPQFGANACDNFFKSTGTKKIIRAHQTAQDGYFTACENKVITVFSAPCYKGVCDNDAAILVIRTDKPEWIFQSRKVNGVLKLKQIIELDE